MRPTTHDPRRTTTAFFGSWVMGLMSCVAVALLAGCGQPTTIGRDWNKVDPPVAAPDFNLQQLDGGTVTLSQFRGQIVIIEFWATWCQPCRFTLPSLEKIYQQYRSRGVVVLLANQDEAPEKIRKWAGKRFTAPILLDKGGRIAVRYGAAGLPHLLIINTEGQFIYAHAGYGGGLERNLKLILDQLLVEKGSDPYG
ncbi:MAG: TlpA family protein disulfide reductase [Candidatus Omnitrophica bacterium]|nr:TlpA family protein disulfide reductase [Candidatus Omnitrophota bacterium]